MLRRPPRATLFPSPPLFRSHAARSGVVGEVKRAHPPMAEHPRQPEQRLRSFGCKAATLAIGHDPVADGRLASLDRKSTRLNSSHANISYAVFCLKKKKYNER